MVSDSIGINEKNTDSERLYKTDDFLSVNIVRKEKTWRGNLYIKRDLRDTSINCNA